MIKVLLLSRYDRLGASSRVRFFQYLPYLRAHGFAITVAPLLGDDYIRGLYAGSIPWFSVGKAYFRRLGRMFQMDQFDMVWVEQEMLPWVPGLIERMLYSGTIPLVVDYDDAVFHRYEQHRKRFVRALFGHKIDGIMRRADVVIAGNDYLGERARKAGARRVALLPTAIDSTRYKLAEITANNDPITIGWIGTPSTAHYLKLVMPILQKMITAYGARVVAVGANEAQLRNSSIRARSWSEDAEIAEIQQFDIGIMPLPDSPYERGKCGYKLIQYMACGKPVIASPVGVNGILVQQGINGFLASTEQEWEAALEALCGDPVQRQEMGKSGKTLVDSQYSLSVTAPKLELLLRSTVKG